MLQLPSSILIANIVSRYQMCIRNILELICVYSCVYMLMFVSAASIMIKWYNMISRDVISFIEN